MKGILTALSAFLALAVMVFATSVPALAVDNSISPLCDGAPEHASYARPGGFCSQVASNKTLHPTGSGWVPDPCTIRYHRN